MQSWHYGMLLKPFVALALIFIARYAAIAVLNRMPDSRLKRILMIRW